MRDMDVGNLSTKQFLRGIRSDRVRVQTQLVEVVNGEKVNSHPTEVIIASD
jgi:hypothetical protein